MGRVSFKQADLERVIRAMKRQGVPFQRIEIEPATGKIIIITEDSEGASTSTALDDWMAKNARAFEGH